MTKRKTPVSKIIDAVTDRLSDLLDTLTPQPDAVPIPVRTDERPRR